MGKSKNNEKLSGISYEYKVYENVIDALDTARNKRKSYMKNGPFVIIGSAVIFLLLMFVTELKVEFLVLWIATILLSIGLMIRTEYTYYRICQVLMIPAEDEEAEVLNKIKKDINNLRSHMDNKDSDIISDNNET
jgi:hypothetical protein